MKKAIKAVGAYLLHKAIKNKAVEKAKKKAKEKESLDGNFYLAFRTSKREWQHLESNIVDQKTKIKVLKLKSLIKNAGGTDIKVVHSDTDTRLYFKIPRTSMNALLSSAKSSVGQVSRGEVKVNK